MLFTETFSFRPLEQVTTHYQLSGMASADSADNEFRETTPEMNRKHLFMKRCKLKKNKQTKNTLRSHTKQINNAS